MDFIVAILAGVISVIFSGALGLIWRSFNIRINDVKASCAEAIEKMEEKMEKLEAAEEKAKDQTAELANHMLNKVDAVISTLNEIKVAQASFVTEMSDRFVTKDICVEKHKPKSGG